MRTLKLKVLDGLGRHTEVSIFDGPDADHLALSGRLTFLTEDVDDFLLLIQGGESWQEERMEPEDRTEILIERRTRENTH